MPPLLADATFWVAVVCALVAQIAIVRAALVASAPTAAPTTPAAARAEAPMRRGREVMWAVVPGVVLAVVLYLTWRTIHPPPPAVHAGAAAAAPSAASYSHGGARA